MSVPFPSPEAERLAALHGYAVLDTLPEQTFNDFTRLASSLCGAPIALISFVDADRQWFKSNIGLPVSEIPRDLAFCAHAILQPNEVLVVQNALEDERFATNTLVTGAPYIRFYAGAPLVSAEGHAFGSLCVLDRVARDLTLEQKDVLQTLGRQVVAQLELHHQLAERMRIEASLKASEAQMRSIIDTALDAVITMDAAGRIVGWSRQAEILFGWTTTEAMGRSLMETIIPPRYWNAHDLGLRHFLAMGEGPLLNRRTEITALRRDGSEFPVELSASHVQIGDTFCFNAFVRDITESKQAEEALRRSEARFRRIAANAPGMLYQFIRRPDGSVGFPFVGEGCRAIFDLEPQEIEADPLTVINLAHPEDRPGFQRSVAESASTLQDWKWEGRFRVTSEEYRWVQAASRPEAQQDGSILWDGLLMDLTASKQAEARLRVLESAVEHAHDVVLITDANLLDEPGPRVLYVNEAFERMTGYNRAEIVGQSPRILQGPKTSRKTLDFLREKLAAWETVQVELLNYRKDGSEFWVELNIRPVSNQEGCHTHWVAIQRDITERKQAERVLQQTHDELERRVFERTHQLAAANMALQVEIVERKRTQAEVSQAYEDTIEGWSHALDLRDKETDGHSRRVSEMTLRLASALNLLNEEKIHIRRGALLHDIGKMGVPDGILLKAGPLTEAERVLMERHPEYAYALLQPIAFLQSALDIPYAHHEKWDGSGYPRGLRGTEIPLAARMFALVDVWDALRSDRPYRAAWPEAKVRAHILNLSGSHFDPNLVDIFLNTV